MVLRWWAHFKACWLDSPVEESWRRICKWESGTTSFLWVLNSPNFVTICENIFFPCVGFWFMLNRTAVKKFVWRGLLWGFVPKLYDWCVNRTVEMKNGPGWAGSFSIFVHLSPINYHWKMDFTKIITSSH